MNKNIICILVLIVLIVSLCFTCYYASKSLGSNMGMRTPSEVPSGMNDNGGTPPEKPDGDASNIDLNGYKLYVNGKVYSK